MSVYREPDSNPGETSPTHKLSSSSRSTMLGASTTRSQPFLNMLNPIGNGRRYAGYAQARQDAVPEEEDDEGENTERENIPLASTSNRPRSQSKSRRGAVTPSSADLRPNIHSASTGGDALDSSDDEVPQSFMIETHARPRTPKSRGKDRDRTSSRPSHKDKDKHQRPILPVGAELPTNLSIPPRPSEISSPGHDPFDDNADLDDGTSASTAPPRPQMRGLDAYERALWNWVNVYNLDAFLQEVYFYYEGKGIYCIALARVLNLLTVGFVIGFSTFLLGCVDYSRIKHEGVTLLRDVVVPRCVSKFSGFTLIFFLLFSAFYLWQIVTFVFAIRRLVDMYHFYTHLLRIPDADIQTISWPEVVRRISAIREENPLTALSSASAPGGNTATAKLDAHDVANRIMRQENYLIALFNKELLDLRVPAPGGLSRFFLTPEEGKGRTLTKALEWNLRFCLMEYLFDPNGKVRKVFLKSKNRNALVEGLRRRFIFMGILNALFAPFIVLYLLMYSFFRYFEEYHKNPSSIGSRRYTLFAQWKFREFNELPHLFARRLDESYPTANIYIAQFPNEKLALLMRFVSFIAGSFAAVLLLASVLDPDLFLHFEITPHKSVLFYLGVFGSVLAAARGMVPDEHRVFDPHELMTDIIQYTHYLPATWTDALHSKRVHAEFGEMFVMKIAIYANELLSVVMTPFVLWWSLPGCAPEIVDFFREFTVHVDGLGYVCSFAVFDFQRHGNVKFGAPTKVDERLTSKEGKMEKSFLNFKAAHPEWTPTDPSGSLYLSRMADYRSVAQPTSFTPHRHRRRVSHDLDHDQGRKDREVRIDSTGTGKDKAREYEAALAQSQAVARKRRGPGAMAASTMLHQPGEGGGMMESTMLASTMGGGPGMAQTAVLGDSLAPSMITSPSRAPATLKAISAEDRTPDEGVGSGLGESYVDGSRPSRVEGPSVGASRVEEEEGLEDGGVLGLLAQIYGTGARGQGPARVIN